ncbi:MAG: TPM domain-containing protein [Sphingobacteriaceae bacterium]
MKKILFAVAILLFAIPSIAQNFPDKPSTLVTDFTNTLSSQEKSALEQKLVAFDDSTSTQIAVVVLKSVGDYDIADYGVQLGRKWGIGQQGKNNGILLLVALGDRKVTIQTGYGAEGALPDVITKEIIENDIKPPFKQGNYYAGLDAGTSSLMKYIKGEYKSDRKRQKNNGGGSIPIVLIIIIVIMIIIFRNSGGGGNQIIGRRGSASPFWWLLMGSAMGRGSSGGGWGGFSGGSGGGGGGFGGFGGGSFGGGGSSGSW